MKKTNYYEIAERKLKYFGYSEATLKSYLHFIDRFLNDVDCSPSRLTADHFTQHLENQKFTSFSQQNQAISALKFFYTKVLEKKYGKVDFQRPRPERKIPRVIDHDMILSKLNQIRNLKHKAILTLAYSDGLRISEVINLKIEDIDSERMIIHIKNAKGRKDRLVPLSPNVLKLLRKYYIAFRPKVYLFNGDGSLQYSRTSCRKIMKRYISESHRFHDLRHSMATYLVEMDTNTRKVADILGHNSTRTTEGYYHNSAKTLRSVPLPV